MGRTPSEESIPTRGRGRTPSQATRKRAKGRVDATSKEVERHARARLGPAQLWSMARRRTRRRAPERLGTHINKESNPLAMGSLVSSEPFDPWRGTDKMRSFTKSMLNT